MTVFPTHSFNEQDIKFRYGERYTSEATNRKFLGIPRGVYAGFDPSFSGNILTLSPDSSYGVSFARVTSREDPLEPLVSISRLYPLDVITSSSVELDFSDHTTFPVYVVLRAYGKLGAPHYAEITTETSYPTDATEVLLGKVTAIGTIETDAPTNRTTPFAYTSAPLGYGFMPGGSAEDLLAAVDILTELEDARVDLEGVTHSPPPPEDGLAERLDTDAAGPAMALRLGYETRTIYGGDASLAADAISVNVSQWFSALYRSVAPVEDIQGFGSETRLGAITSGSLPTPTPTGAVSDNDRNLCAIYTSDQQRITDDDGNPIYGRLSHRTDTIIGHLYFNGLTVTGVGTEFVTQGIEKGDLVECPDGSYYAVASTPTLETSLTLVTSAPIVDGSGLELRRFTLEFWSRTNETTETSVELAIGTTVEFYFTLWVTLEESQFDYLPYLLRHFDTEPIVDATTSVAGKVLLADGLSDPKAGALYSVRDTNVTVGDGNFHTLNFEGAVDGALPGIVNVTQRGPTGIPGQDAEDVGVVGPKGPTGPRGIGFDWSIPYFLLESNLTVRPPGTGNVSPGYPYSNTYDFTGIVGASREIRFITIGFSKWRKYSDDWSEDFCYISAFSKTGPRSIQYTVTAPVGNPNLDIGIFVSVVFSDVVTWGT